MANNKKPRKKGSIVRRKSNHIGAVLNRAIAKFHIIGDMNHIPTAFHFGDIALHLKGKDLEIAQEHALEYLCLERKTWTFMGLFFFKSEEGIEIIPSVMEVENTVLGEMGKNGEDYLKQMRDSIYSENPHYSDDTLEFYGYYLTYGNNLNISSVEDQLCASFFKITNDLESIEPHVVEITEDKVMTALGRDKFHLVDSKTKTTEMKLMG